MDAQETDAPKVYVVMASDPAEQGHSNRSVAIFFDKDLADDAAMKWGFEAEDEVSNTAFSRWTTAAAVSFYVEEVSVITSADAIPAKRDVYP